MVSRMARGKWLKSVAASSGGWSRVRHSPVRVFLAAKGWPLGQVREVPVQTLGGRKEWLGDAVAGPRCSDF